MPLRRTEGIMLSSPMDACNYRIRRVDMPIEDLDSANKVYVDTVTQRLNAIVFVNDYIANDGSDVTEDLQDLIDSNGDGVTYLFSGEYLIDGITISNTDITFTSLGKATIIVTDFATKGIYLDNATRFKCHDLYFDIDYVGVPTTGVDSDYDYFISGISENAYIHDCNAQGLGLCRLNVSENCIIERNILDSKMTADDIYDAGDTRLLYGIRLENTANFRVLHNTISRYGRDGIKTMLSNNDGQTETDTEVGFIAYNYLYGMTVQDAIDVFNNGVRIVIHGNIAENCAKMMNVKTETTQNYLNIHHNIISSNIFKGSKYFNPDYAAFQYALHLKSSNTIVSNNLFYNMIGAGMIVDDCENVNITSNTVYDLDANTEDLSGIGIYVSSSVKNANFTCNNIKDCAKYGYDIDNYDFTMSGCCLTSTGDRGININPSSSLKAELRKGFTISGIKIVDLVGTMTKGISCGATCLGDAVVTGCLVGIEIPTKFQNDSDFVRDLGNSWNPRTSYQTAIPTTGTWTLGDLVYNSAPASSEDSGWTCTQSGTLGTLVGVTGSVTINEDVLTVNTVAGLTYGMYIDIVGVTGTKQIISIDETNLTLILSSVSDATVATAAVSYSAPVFKSVGTIA